jgi:tungstate transport system ATP-binding protein
VNESLYLLQDVRQEYNGRRILAIDHLEIRRGEILAIVGPSGAGKSTLLRLLNFLESPAAGELRFEGRPAQGTAPLSLRRRVTTVFQTPGLLNRSVVDNLTYGLWLRGQKVSGQELQVWLNRFGLSEVAGHRPRELSAGEAQRTSLARALIIRPDVLLLDEPTANLDPSNVAHIEAVLRQENAANGTTLVLVTHNVFQARRLAQRTGLLWNGQLVELAPTTRFFERPQQPETAAFVRGELLS